MSNMDDFDKVTAAVLANLYQSFPQKIKISVEDVFDNPDQNTIMNFDGTVMFLAAEGFLKFDHDSDEGKFFVGVVLTLKGLRILHSVPDILKEQPTLGQRMVNILKGGAKEASKEGLKAVVKEALSAAI